MSSSIFDWFHLIAANAWLYGGAFILVLSILVFVHEWGHYIVARKCGVKIDSFSIGFGPELFGRTDRHGTRWKLSLVPMGGYVKMFGDVDPASAGHIEATDDGAGLRPLTASERKVAFFSQNVARRAAIVFAGPAINFLFAIIVMSLLFIFYGQPVTPPVAAAVMGDSAAARAGFQPHDEVVAIDGHEITRFEDIRREVMVGLDTPRIFKVKRDGKLVDIKATPDRETERDRFGFPHTKGLLGLISAGNAIDIKSIRAVNGEPFDDPAKALQAVQLLMGTTFEISIERAPGQVDKLFVHPVSEQNKDIALDPATAGPGSFAGALVVSSGPDEVLVKYGPLGGIREALRQTWDVTSSTLVALGQMITGTRSATELGGIIRIGAIAGDMAKSGFIALVTFTALLSINLGLINLFPIPMLDGGHLLFYAIEAVKGSPISEQIQEYAFRLGLVILGGIMLFANLNDLVQLIR
jgi:regulator of sigma E protease